MPPLQEFRRLRNSRARYRRPIRENEMNDYRRHIDFPGRIVMLGFGSVGQGSLPLILRHLGTRTENITIVTADDRGRREAEALGDDYAGRPMGDADHAGRHSAM